MLSKRLSTVLSLISAEDKIADIGCDHGYLACACIEKGISFVQVVDNKEGPLCRARENLHPFLTKAKIEMTLASGLTALVSEVDTVIICGMGGELIGQMLTDSFAVASRMKKIILQPNTKIDYLRKYLDQNGFTICDERITFDNNKYYEIISAIYSDRPHQLSDMEYLFGPKLLKEKSQIFLQKWQFRYQKISAILEKTETVQATALHKEQKWIQEVLYGSY